VYPNYIFTVDINIVSLNNAVYIISRLHCSPYFHFTVSIVTQNVSLLFMQMSVSIVQLSHYRDSTVTHWTTFSLLCHYCITQINIFFDLSRLLNRQLLANNYTFCIIPRIKGPRVLCQDYNNIDVYLCVILCMRADEIYKASNKWFCAVSLPLAFQYRYFLV